MGRVAVIASLYPAPFRAQRPSFTQRDYVIRRCTDLTKPEICVVEDQTERPYIGHGRVGTQTWAAADVAQDVVNEWSTGALGRADDRGDVPAIWVSEGAKFVGGEWVIPQEEIAHWRAKQEGVLNRLYQIGRMMFEKKLGEPLDVCKNAAEMLNIKGEPWQTVRTSQSSKPCPYCAEINSAEVAICRNCRQVLDKERFDQLQAAILKTELATEPGGGRLTADEQKEHEQAATPAVAVVADAPKPTMPLGPPLAPKNRKGELVNA